MREHVIPCRSCGTPGLTPVFSFGQTPLANRLLTAEQVCQPEPTYPLNLAFCPVCALVQITETVPPEELFREYMYFSSVSDTVVDNAREIVERMVVTRRLTSSSLVVEVASNDGYLLRHYRERGIPVLGIEPARNVARVAQEKYGIRTLAEFFGTATANQLKEQGELADVVHANNVLAHVADLNGVVSGIKTILKDEGVAVIEVPYVKDLMDHEEIDTVYHEHLCYFSMTALNHLFRRHQLMIADVERNPIHGGSLRVFVQKEEGPRRNDRSPTFRVGELLREERTWGVDRCEFYLDFGTRVKRLGDGLLAMLKELKCQDKRIAAYGASAKGSTLLNYFKIGRSVIDFVVDRSEVKQGHFTPGTHIPILSPERLMKDPAPDFVLLLTWNFAEEILAQQDAYRRKGGRFIIPIPQVKIV